MKKLLVALLMVLPLSVSAQKFGHFDSDAVLQALPEYSVAQKELETKTKTAEEELSRMQEELKTKADDYQKNQASLPEDIQKRREQELMEINQRLEEFYNKTQQDLQQYRMQKMQDLQQKILKAVEEVGMAGGYVYILDVNSLPYISKTLSTDVTSQVKTKLGIK